MNALKVLSDTNKYQYDWGRTGVKYSSEFDELMDLLKVYDAE